MMIQRVSIHMFLLFFLITPLISQKADSTMVSPWEFNVSIGTDVSQLLQINPRVGAGENRLGIGWVVNATTNYDKDKISWDNTFDWNFGIVRLGEGFLAGASEKVPFQKSIDEIRFKSKLGSRLKSKSKFYYAVNFSLLSQMTRTYDGNYLKDIKEPEVDNPPISRLFSPAQLTMSLGIDYKPNKKLSFFLSPVGYKAILVLDDAIADDVVRDKSGKITGSVHGNPIMTDATNTELLGFDNVRNEIGSLLRVSYAHTFREKSIQIKSGLLMYYNYRAPLSQIDYEWTTETSFLILKGLNISLLTNFFYDYDVFAYRSNLNLEEGVEPTPERDLISFTEQLVIKYNVSF